jgi:hypothetical protein
MDKYLKQLLKIDVAQKSAVILREDVGEYVHIFSHIRLSMYVELLILNLKVELIGSYIIPFMTFSSCYPIIL